MIYREKLEFSYGIVINSIALVPAENFCGLGQQNHKSGVTTAKK